MGWVGVIWVIAAASRVLWVLLEVKSMFFVSYG